MLTHRKILHEVWGPSRSDNTQYLRVFVGQLRKKIEKHPAMPVVIATELGIGYRMEYLQDSKINKQGELSSGGGIIFIYGRHHESQNLYPMFRITNVWPAQVARKAHGLSPLIHHPLLFQCDFAAAPLKLA